MRQSARKWYWTPAALMAVSVVTCEAAVDFVRQVKPVLESACIGCHGPDKQKGDLRFDTEEYLKQGADGEPVVVPGNPEKSTLYSTTVLPADHDEIMPPKGEPLDPVQTEVLKAWIAEGAQWPKGVTLTQVQRIDFVKDIQPILEFNCVACHRDDYQKGELSYSSKEVAFNSGESGPSIRPFKPERSRAYTTMVLPADSDELMPPASKGGPLEKKVTELVRLWIEQGAVWPEGVTLSPKKKAAGEGGDNMELVQKLHDYIVANHKVEKEADMKAYSNQIPDTRVDYHMVAIPGGSFQMGSPAGEKDRKADEGPVHTVKVDPFWMGKYEVTWNEFELFMYPPRTTVASTDAAALDHRRLIDAVSRPTKPYVEMSFGMGKDQFPAISMTQHSANKFCQWLSAKTGHFYRLPTEAEWEYACRAGTTTVYSFGDDASKLKEYAWYEANSDWKYQKVGTKKPNPWGLYDMHGNVAEWCIDQYAADFYATMKGEVSNPWNYGKKLYPRVVRGGSWDHNPDLLRSAARISSNADWKIQDPQLPKSIWYHTDAQFLGMRVVRPLKMPSAEEMYRYWNHEALGE